LALAGAALLVRILRSQIDRIARCISRILAQVGVIAPNFADFLAHMIIALVAGFMVAGAIVGIVAFTGSDFNLRWLIVMATSAYSVALATRWLAQRGVQPPGPNPLLAFGVLTVVALSVFGAVWMNQLNKTGPGGSPTPSPMPSPDELFARAFSSDEAGRNDEAIALYDQAISAGLMGNELESAHLEIGLLEVLEISKLNPEADQTEIANRCRTAREHYIAISSSPTAEQLESAIKDACGPA